MPGPETSLGDFLEAEDALGELLEISVSLVSARSEAGRTLYGRSMPWEEAIAPAEAIDGYSIGERVRHYAADMVGVITGFRHESQDGYRITVADVTWDNSNFGCGSLAAFQIRPTSTRGLTATSDRA